MQAKSQSHANDDEQTAEDDYVMGFVGDEGRPSVGGNWGRS